MFYNCIKLEYLNLNSFYTKILDEEESNKNLRELNRKIFSNIPDYLVFCINITLQSDIFLNQLLSKSCSVNYCSSDWRSKKRKKF